MSSRKRREAAMKEKRQAKVDRHNQMKGNENTLGNKERENYLCMYEALGSEQRNGLPRPNQNPSKEDYQRLRVVYQDYIRGSTPTPKDSNLTNRLNRQWD